MKPITFERDAKLYIVAPVTPTHPSEQDIEEYAFSKSIIAEHRQRAPNENLAWFSGHYVEADKPNLNGAMWLSDELAIKSLTPMLMPVTVMHDPSSAVGLIADIALREPGYKGVANSRIESVLALWRHRFPEAVEEAEHNYTAGTLSQSMECLLSGYNCGECGQLFHRLPDRAEEANWCDHLKAPGATRILRDVTFTGTGLIFGSRGAEPGDPGADLESFQSEVAEFHQRTQTDGTRSRRSKPKMDEITLARSEYDRIVKERDDAVARAQTVASERDVAAEAQKAAEREQEAAETAKVQAETKVTELEGKVNLAEEAARQGKLADERFDALGAGFTAKLGEKTKGRLKAQASALSDDEWSERLDELEEMAGVKRDEGGEPTDTSDGKTFTDEEVARSKTGTSTNEPTEPSVTMRRSVIQGLLTKS